MQVTAIETIIAIERAQNMHIDIGAISAIHGGAQESSLGHCYAINDFLA
jgi:hypothetical protein